MSGDGVHVLLLHVKAACVVELVGGKVVPAGQQVVVVDLVERAGAVDGAVDIGDLVDGQSRVERVGDLDNRVLAHAVDEDVGARVEQHRALELVLPVVVVGQTAQARLDAADNDGSVLERLTDEVAVDRDGSIGAVPLLAAGGIGIGAAAVLGHRIVVDHGVHVAGADEKAQAWLAEHGDTGGVGPVGLADDTHLVAMCIEHAADDGHAKTGVVHIGVATDVDKVALVPAACIHVSAADGEELVAARAPGADRRCRGMRGARALGLAATLLLLAALGMLAVLVVLSVLGLFCHDSSRCQYAARNCNQSFWDGAKKTGGVHELADRHVDAGAVRRPPFVSRLCICALGNPSRVRAMLSMGYSMNGGYVSANARESRQQGGCTTMQRAKQISESLELGIILALAGGFMDVYSYIGRDHVFANAQTGNILLVGVSISEGNWALAGRYFFPVVSFAVGIMLADLVHERFGSVIHWRQVTVFFEAVILLGVSFIPGGDFNLLANCLTSFACGMQVESFRKIHGHGIATTMCIGNLRNALQNVDDYIITHKRGFLENGLLYFGVIFTFVFGAVLGNWCIEHMGLHAIVVASVLLFVAFAIMFIDRERDLRFRWKVAAEAWKEGCRR